MIIAVSLAFSKVSFILGAVLALAALLTWVERKQSALMQDRIGANRADILGFRIIGLFHIIADTVKMLTKEDFIPRFADKFAFRIAPVLAATAAVAGFLVIPFGPTVRAFGIEVPNVIMRSEVGVLVLLAAVGLGIYGMFLGGAASNSRWASLGTLRAAAMMASYEAAIGLSLAGVLMVYGTLDLGVAVDAQAGTFAALPWLPKWGMFLQPFGFLLFLAAAAAETKRVPFDLPEGESEIIGYFLEYSGMRFGLFFMAELIETILFSAVVTVLFLGGWHLPGLDYGVLPWWMSAPVGIGIFWAKTAAMCWFFMLVRWTLPRFRFDQVLDLGWKWLLPLSLLNMFATAGVLLAIGELWK